MPRLIDHPQGTPGSQKARDHGCICPVEDNMHGEGYALDNHGEELFLVHTKCLVHQNVLSDPDYDSVYYNPN